MQICFDKIWRDSVSQEALISKDEFITLTGSSNAQRRYQGRTAIICIVVSIVLCIFNFTIPIPLLLVVATLMGRAWKRNGKSLKLMAGGLKYGEDIFSWEDIKRYTTWGPFGIYWTPINFYGIKICFPEGKEVYVSSNSPGFDLLLHRLKKLKFSSPEGPLWHEYPACVIRFIREALAILFCVVYIMFLLFKWFILLSAGGFIAYLIFRMLRRNKTGKTFSRDFWISIILCTSILLLFYLLSNSFWLLLIAVAVISVILWIPWKPDGFIIVKNTLFVGKNNAYPLRHLKTSQVISKYFLLKKWRLKFANGQVDIYPLLENFEEFKSELEKNWESEQDSPANEEETIVRKPKAEAKFLQSNIKDLFQKSKAC